VETQSSVRRMAHDRWPPMNYVRCFRPNVDALRASYRVVKREFGDNEIRACEREFRQRLAR
jgi:hypothetical protein